jgi:hypothetical protein
MRLLPLLAILLVACGSSVPPLPTATPDRYIHCYVGEDGDFVDGTDERCFNPAGTDRTFVIHLPDGTSYHAFYSAPIRR